MEPTYNNYQTLPRSNNRLKIGLILVLLLCVVGLVLAKLLAHLGDGTVIVTTNSSANTITVIETSVGFGENQTKPVPKNSKPKTYRSGQKISLKPGAYFINVQNGDIAAAQTTQVIARQTNEYTINLASAIPAPEPVGDINSTQFTVGNSQILYVDNHSNILYRVDGSNQVSPVNGLALSTVDWVDDSFGVGQDTSGTLYTVNNGNVSPLNNLPAVNGNNAPVYAVAPNRDIYLAFGKEVYAGNLASGFRHIYTASHNNLNLAATNDRVAVAETADAGSQQGGVLAVISKDGKVRRLSDFDGTASWSASGKYLATKSEEPSVIYDNSLKRVAVVPNLQPQTFAWQEDKALFYSFGGQLWRYDLASEQSKVVAGTNSDRLIVGLQSDASGNYLYITTQVSGAGGIYYSLYRYGLRGQSVSTAAQQLDDRLPWLTDGCFLSLMNFTQPTVEVVESNVYDSCIPIAKNYVQQLGISPNDFAYKLSSVLPSTPSR